MQVRLLPVTSKVTHRVGVLFKLQQVSFLVHQEAVSLLNQSQGRESNSQACDVHILDSVAVPSCIWFSRSLLVTSNTQQVSSACTGTWLQLLD